jgi:biotin transporter BioY
MPIMPTIVSFRGGDAVVPTSCGFFGGIASFVAAAIGYLEAHISAESAIGGLILTTARMVANRVLSDPAADVLDIVAEEDVP